MAAYKIGDVFYEAYAEQGKVSIHLYVLRTIRGGVAYLIEKNECTWGKRSKKNGDYGWLDPIDSSYRHALHLDGVAINSFGRSVPGALRNALASERKRLKRFPDDPEYIAEVQKDIDALLRRLSREKSKGGNHARV